VSWDEALDFISRRMRKVGPEAVGLWAGHGGFTPGSTVTVQMMQRFANMYGCQNWHPAMICCAAIITNLGVKQSSRIAEDLACGPARKGSPDCPRSPFLVLRYRDYGYSGGILCDISNNERRKLTLPRSRI
jgi:hypothetical protein